MTFRPHSADEGLLSWLERWAPAEAEVWARWRQSLSAQQRAGALLPLQAALSGLVAFRHLENHPSTESVPDFRPHLHAMRVTCAWALELAHELGAGQRPEHRLRPVVDKAAGPTDSLETLGRSLRDALRVSERLLDLPGVDAAAFAASCDLFLRDLGRNEFFRPSDPLEFSNVAELFETERLGAHLSSLGNGAGKTTMIVAFLSLLRSHRFLAIADEQMSEDDGTYRAHVLLAGSRREIRTLTQFLLVQGGEGVEALAMGLQDVAEAALGEPLPTPGSERGLAASAERTRNGIRRARRAVKEAAKRLRDLGNPAVAQRAERKSERVQRDLTQDIWAFRFIMRGFLAKASVVELDVDAAHRAEALAFAAEFVRHFRVFGPRLAKGTGYQRRAALIRAVSALSRRDDIDRESLGLAVRECTRFVEHLDEALERGLDPSAAAFDKQQAAAELRVYLAGARDRFSSGPAPAGAFGLGNADQAEAS